MNASATPVEPPFAPRFKSLLAHVYQGGNLPEVKLASESALIFPHPGEFWATGGEESRLTRLVLAAHRYRLICSLRHDEFAGIVIVVESRTHAPGLPAHHPGLSDLIAQAHALAPKQATAPKGE